MRILSIAKACPCGGSLRFSTRDGITMQARESCGRAGPVARIAPEQHPLVAVERAERARSVARFPTCAGCDNHVSRTNAVYCADCGRDRRLAKRRVNERKAARRSA